MPIHIGRREPGCEDPVGLMTACHRRIELFLQRLCYAARNCGGRPLTPEECEAVGSALRYFREAAPNHTADEEEDLFPALLERIPDVAEPLKHLEADHRRAAELHAQVDVLGERWILDKVLPDEALQRFRNAADELSALYAAHIRLEEGDLYPKASSALSGDDLETIGRRMAARRGIPYPQRGAR